MEMNEMSNNFMTINSFSSSTTNPATIGNKKKAIGYMRVSTEEQTDGASKQTQKAAIEKYAADNDIEIVDWYWDGGFSAKTAKRPDLQRLLNNLESGKYPDVEYVVVYNTSRISRNIDSFAAEIATRLTRCHVSVRSTKEPVDDTPLGKFMLTLTVAMHQLDNDVKSATVHDNMHTTAMNGWWQSTPPVGMKTGRLEVDEVGRDGKRKRHSILVPDEEGDMAAKVAKVLIRFSKGDMTVAELARYAAKLGIRTRKGNYPSRETMTNMLKQAAYAGYIQQDKLTDGKLVKAKWSGIIPLDVYLDNIARLKDHGRKNGKKEVHLVNNPDYPLKGTLICQNCHRPLSGSAPTCGSGAKSPRYHCPRCKGMGSVSPSIVHEDFMKFLESITPTPETIKLFRIVLKRTLKGVLRETNKEVKEKRAELSGVDDTIAKTLEKFVIEKITEDEKNRLETALKEKRNELENEIARLEKQQSLSERSIDRLVDFMGAPVKLWAKADLPTRQLLQRMVFPNGIVYDLKEKKFGTSEISPLYSVNFTKKEPNGSENASLVRATGLEPAQP